MGILGKLLGPLFLAFVLFYGVIHFFWEPSLLEKARDNSIGKARAMLTALEPELTRGILADDMGSVYSNLEQIRERNKDWIRLVVKDSSGRMIFSLGETEVLSGRSLETVTHSLDFGGDPLAVIELTFDWSGDQNIQVDEINYLEFLAMVIFAGLSALGFVAQTIWIRNPIIRLKEAAGKLEKGDYKTELPKPSRDEIGELTRSFSNMRESLRLSQMEMRSSLEQAEKASQAKSEFLSRMSHELRTPMNAILGFGQLLKMDIDQKEDLTNQKRIDHILKAGGHLLDLINEVLDLSSIEEGKLSVSLEPVDIVLLGKEVVSLVRPLADELRITIVDCLPEMDSCYVMADRVRLKQVFLNIISNAVKYNRIDGSVSIYYVVENDVMRFSVEDTGSGIEEEKRELLFKPFERLGAETSEIEGTGIGLSISRKLMELMKGSIDFRSQPGKGTCFYVELPVVKGEVRKVREEPGAESLDKKATSAEKTVLYIEDNPDNLELVRQILESRINVNFLSAPHAGLGIELAKNHLPDLILLDINLPGMDGFTAFKKMKMFNEISGIPVIAVSADAMESDKKKALDMGFNSYVTKPINVANLINEVNEVLTV